MRLSAVLSRLQATHVFTPTLHVAPAGAQAVSHQLMLRAGLIRQCAAGVYSLLPVAVRVLNNVSAIIHEEMHRIGGQQVILPCLTPAKLWQTTGRYDVRGEKGRKMSWN